MPLTGLLSNAPPQAATLSHPFQPQKQILVFNGTWSTGLPFFTLRSETFCRDVQRRARNDDFSIKSATKLGAGTPIRIRRHERRPIHRISASRLQQSARPYLLRCSRPCLFLRGLLPRRLWRFGALMLNYPLGFADASLVSASIIPVRGSQIGKTKLSVRKAEERP